MTRFELHIKDCTGRTGFQSHGHLSSISFDIMNAFDLVEMTRATATIRLNPLNPSGSNAPLNSGDKARLMV